MHAYCQVLLGTPSDVPAANIMNSRAKAKRCRSPADNVAVQSRTSWCREKQIMSDHSVWKWAVYPQLWPLNRANDDKATDFGLPNFQTNHDKPSEESWSGFGCPASPTFVELGPSWLALAWAMHSTCMRGFTIKSEQVDLSLSENGFPMVSPTLPNIQVDPHFSWFSHIFPIIQ